MFTPCPGDNTDNTADDNNKHAERIGEQHTDDNGDYNNNLYEPDNSSNVPQFDQQT